VAATGLQKAGTVGNSPVTGAMDIPHIISIAASVGGAMSVAISAWFWWKSSEVDIDPPIPGFTRIPSSADGDYSATVAALQEIGRLNKQAATWSAASAIFFAVSAVI
jgi:hypothetical protein